MMKQHERLVPLYRKGTHPVWGPIIEELLHLRPQQVLLIPVPPGKIAKDYRANVSRMVRRYVQRVGGRWFRTTLAGPNVRVTRKR